MGLEWHDDEIITPLSMEKVHLYDQIQRKDKNRQICSALGVIFELPTHTDTLITSSSIVGLPPRLELLNPGEWTKLAELLWCEIEPQP